MSGSTGVSFSTCFLSFIKGSIVFFFNPDDWKENSFSLFFEVDGFSFRKVFFSKRFVFLHSCFFYSYSNFEMLLFILCLIASRLSKLPIDEDPPAFLREKKLFLGTCKNY